MILDILENAYRYSPLNRGFAKAVAFLLREDLKDLPVGRYEIDGERVYAMVAKEQGRNKEDALLEIHKQYIDIQLVLRGTDTMGWRPKSLCRNSSADYDQESDLQFFLDRPDHWFAVEQGTFAIFFPEDAHLPMISTGQLHKVVVKVAVEGLLGQG